tara:strand:+ start:314 stop:844 length:531 start_codon:yes stop_codon:yes gene_type:complete
MNIQIKDNFLPLDTFLEFKKLVQSNKFGWYLCNVIDIPPGTEKTILEKSFVCDQINNYQLTHFFYFDNAPQSKYYEECIRPFIDLLDIKSLIRAKINLNPKTEKTIRHGFHKDNDIDESFTSVFYFNTTNGYTEFENGEKIEDVENRLIKFPSHYLHSGNTCTNNSYRIVLNLNYF